MSPANLFGEFKIIQDIDEETEQALPEYFQCLVWIYMYQLFFGIETSSFTHIAMAESDLGIDCNWFQFGPV